MFLRTEQEVKYYMRRSKGGKHHTYKRMRTIVVFQCDDCKEEFKRDKGKVGIVSKCFSIWTLRLLAEMSTARLGAF